MSTPTRTRTGIPWHAQRLGEPPLDVLRRIRHAVQVGEFNRKSLDHNHGKYTSGLSNKQVTIIGAWLMGWDDPTQSPPYDRCFEAVMESITGLRDSDS